MKIINKIILILCLFSIFILGQENLPRLSPKSFVGQTVGYTNVTINYGSPGVKGREIWGKLVPYNEVWRTGANEATTIEIDKPVFIEGNKVPAGKYSLFTIPNIDSWVVILNKVYEQWGAYKYDSKEDILRFNVKPMQNQHRERLTFMFEYQEAYKSKIILEWEKIKIEINLDTQVED